MPTPTNPQQWNTPPSTLQLSPDEIHVWQASLVVSEATLQQLTSTLSSKEQNRAASFHFDKDRTRWMVARAVLRILLARYLNTDPHHLDFDTNLYGKPFLTHPSLPTPLQFNLSHSGDLALYAFTYARHIGIDIEYKRAGIDYDALARVSFAPNERAALRSLPDSLQHDAFYNCWSRKEAYIKARGKGIYIPLDQFDVSLLPGVPAALLHSREDPEAPTHWTLHDLPSIPDYASALAVEGSNWNLTCWRFTS